MAFPSDLEIAERVALTPTVTCSPVSDVESTFDVAAAWQRRGLRPVRGAGHA
jgi:hypothetical protein